MRLSPLRSAFNVVIIATMITMQFAVPVCGMEAEDGGAAHHSLPAAEESGAHRSDSHPGGTASHPAPSVHHGEGGEMAGHPGPSAESSSDHHDAGPRGDGHEGASECLGMSACAAPALGAGSPVQLQTPASHAASVPSPAPPAGSIFLNELKRPPKSL